MHRRQNGCTANKEEGAEKTGCERCWQCSCLHSKWKISENFLRRNFSGQTIQRSIVDIIWRSTVSQVSHFHCWGLIHSHGAALGLMQRAKEKNQPHHIFCNSWNVLINLTSITFILSYLVQYFLTYLAIDND